MIEFFRQYSRWIAAVAAASFLFLTFYAAFFMM